MVDGGLCLTGNLGEQYPSRGTRGGQSFVRAASQGRGREESHRQLVRDMALHVRAERPTSGGAELSKIKAHRNESLTSGLYHPLHLPS